MPKIKSVLLILLCATLILPLFPLTVSADAPSVSAQSALLMEADSGAVIFEKQAGERLPMASTTKIMTALVALDLASPDTVIAVSPAAVGVEGSSVYLCEGELLTLEELLYSLLLESANDAAAAIAIGLCGSISAFADRMNQKATELGLTNTHFTNPHGLDEEEHYTTATDLAMIARAALRHPLFAEIVATRKMTISHTGIENVRLLVNHNKLLRMYDGCIGVKTGFTKRSGRCLVSAAERDGVRLIAVTLNAPDDWKDHTTLLDYGFSFYERVTLCEENAFSHALPIVNGTQSSVLVTHGAYELTLPRDRGPITSVIELSRFEFAPLPEGATIGSLVFYCDTDRDGRKEEIGRVALRTASEVTKRKRRSFWQWLSNLFAWIRRA